MLKQLFTLFFILSLFTASANNGHHAGGGNSGNGKGNGGAVIDPGDVGGDPDAEPTQVPFDSGIYLLITFAVVYGLLAQHHYKKKQSQVSH